MSTDLTALLAALPGVPGKCHFDSHGWLQGPIAITHYLSPNHYPSGFADNARGLAQHTEDGYTAGTVATFMNPAAQVSAFFGVSESGAAQQFLPLGQGYVAWAEGAGNPYWRSTECEDMTRTGDPMPPLQVATFAQILEACSAYDSFPLQVTDDPSGGYGLITHGDGGVAWGNHPDCPGDVRRAQRAAIIALAKLIRAGGPGWVDCTTTGSLSLIALAKGDKTLASTILRETVDAHGPFSAGLAAYINHGDLTAPMPAGLVVRVPASPAG